MPIFIERFLLAILAATVILIIANPMKLDNTQRVTLVIAVVALACFLAHTLHKYNESQKQPAREDSGVPTEQAKNQPKSEPPLIELVVNGNKQFHIENKGNVALSNVKCFMTLYRFNQETWTKARPLQLEGFERHGEPFLKVDELTGRDSTPVVDLATATGFRFPESDKVAIEEGLINAVRRFYAIRVTFRDKKTGEEYVAYRVTGSIKHLGHVFENTAEKGSESGGPGHMFMRDIPFILISHQREIYRGDGMTEIAIKYTWEH